MPEFDNPIAIVLPAFNAGKTLASCIRRIPSQVKADIILCDDGSRDDTLQRAKELQIITLVHGENRGYGANQKTLYRYALEHDYRYVVMLHPDDQYDPATIPIIIAQLEGGCEFVMGNRMHEDMARQGHMPWWRRFSNRLLSQILRTIYPVNLGEYHSGLRGFRSSLLQSMPFEKFHDDYHFDSEMLAAVFSIDAKVGQVNVQCQYTKESSSPNFWRSLRYGLQTIGIAWRYRQGYYRSLVKNSHRDETMTTNPRK